MDSIRDRFNGRDRMGSDRGGRDRYDRQDRGEALDRAPRRSAPSYSPEGPGVDMDAIADVIEQSNSKLGYNSARIGQLIKRDLKKIGIQCNIIEMSEKSIKNLLPYQGYDIIVAQQPFSRLLPLYRLYHNFACNSRNKPARSNYSSYCSQELSEAISNIQYAPLELDLSEEYNRIQELLLLSVPFIPIAYNSDTFIYNKDITTLKSLLVNGFDFSETKFREVE